MLKTRRIALVAALTLTACGALLWFAHRTRVNGVVPTPALTPLVSRPELIPIPEARLQAFANELRLRDITPPAHPPSTGAVVATALRAAQRLSDSPPLSDTNDFSHEDRAADLSLPRGAELRGSARPQIWAEIDRAE